MSMFNPRAKILANLDRALEFIQTGNTSPVLVEIDPSNACNHGCYFCISSYIHLPESKHLATYNKSIMPREVLLNLCKDLNALKVRAINWTGGGEPTINPALKDAIRYVGFNSDIKMGIFTNGTLLDKFDLFDDLVKYFSWVRVSVDAGKPETYNSIRRTTKINDWDKMVSNLNTLVSKNKDNKIDIGVGFVITKDNYTEIVDFAKFFKDFPLAYCQYKPEIVNKERDGGIQRSVDFWEEKVAPLVEEAKSILGDKFQINGYKINDLVNDLNYGRHYKKCLGSQLQPCVGADGHVYICTNQRGYKQYSYGSLYDKGFLEIWNDMEARSKVTTLINDVECFSNCTQLCKPHESNKIMWDLYTAVKETKHPEFI